MNQFVLSAQLQSALAVSKRDDKSYEVWQLKLNHRDGARIWFYVIGNEVRLELIFTGHPNETQ